MAAALAPSPKAMFKMTPMISTHMVAMNWSMPGSTPILWATTTKVATAINAAHAAFQHAAAR